MKRWHLLEQVVLTGGSTMTLHAHQDDYAIRVDGRELMSSRHAYSEEQLAVVGCGPYARKADARVLIGGLGLGFTLKAALQTLGSSARVVVVELLPDVVAWNRNQAYNLAAASLADSRTEIEIGDVGVVVGRYRDAFDAILLDADNETTSMNTSGNSGLYRPEGLARVHGALRSGGRAVYWSAGEEPRFAELMGRCGFRVDVQKVSRHAGGGGYHYLLTGIKR